MPDTPAIKIQKIKHVVNFEREHAERKYTNLALLVLMLYNINKML